MPDNPVSCIWPLCYLAGYAAGYAAGKGKGQVALCHKYELNIDITPRIDQIKVEEPPVRQKGVMVSDVAELVNKLKHEAKVL